MDFDERLGIALARVSKTGMWHSNYAPPIYHCLWFVGIEVPPPHFATFAFNALFSGAWFGICWTVVMRLMFWSPVGLPAIQALVFATFIGTIFGVLMASYYAIGAWRYHLPCWSKIGIPATTNREF
ncbi:MAG TPA: DUF6404 family protein [Lacipirellulaceae bacterium]|jgi:hypothetical protein|nr:DUF6404 family protein [Lacipirellulaceae bacterium]